MKKVFLYMMIAAGVITSGCSNFVEKATDWENDPTEVVPSMLLTNSEVSMFAIYGGEFGRISAMWTQQMEGVDAQMLEYGRYNFKEGDITNEWDLLYSETLDGAIDLVNTFGADNPYYGGMGKILQAMAFGVATDAWGDIPMSEAGQGGDNFNPNYDKQEDVIKAIQALLTSGIADLNGEAKGLIPGGDDIIFGGDLDAWIAAAYTLKARYALRLSNVSGTASADALAALSAGGIASSAGDMMMVFGASGNDANTWSSFDISRPDYLKAGAFIVSAMELASDPRRAFYFTTDTGGIYRGAALGSGDVTASSVGSWLKSSMVPMVSYVEAKFIEAEASFATDKTASAAAYNEAVKASIMQVTGAADPVYEAIWASATDATISLDFIYAQKYVAMYGQVEAYNDWRRTGFPALTPHPNGSIATIPVRWPTAIEERLYNTNSPATPYTLIENVWWDQ